MTAVEFLDAGDDVSVLYDGSGVDTLAAASASDHQLHGLAKELRADTRRLFCAQAHGVGDAVTTGGRPLLEEYSVTRACETRSRWATRSSRSDVECWPRCDRSSVE